MKNLSIIDSNNQLSPLLSKYLENKFVKVTESSEELINSEDSTLFWDAFISQSKVESKNILEQLAGCFPQLLFPISEETCRLESYKNAILRGDFDHLKFSESLLKLQCPSNISLKMYEGWAGRIPILSFSNHTDFEIFIQAILYKSMPIKIPYSMGAALIHRVNNWKKIKDLKLKWQSSRSLFTWAEEFKNNIVPYPTLYKEQLIIICQKPYSNVDASYLGFNKKEWLEISNRIRIEHEGTHLYTLKKYGRASNNLHDELVADYAGICLVSGSFQKKWMLYFLGLEDFPLYRIGARLENYIENIEIKSQDFAQLCHLIFAAIENIEAFDKLLNKENLNTDMPLRIEALCTTDILEMSSENGWKILLEKYYKNNKTSF